MKDLHVFSLTHETTTGETDDVEGMMDQYPAANKQHKKKFCHTKLLMKVLPYRQPKKACALLNHVCRFV